MKIMTLVVLILYTCMLCSCKSVIEDEQPSSTAPINEYIEYIEILVEGQEVEGLTYENEGGTWGKILVINEDSVTINICKWISDESSPSGVYIQETDEEKTIFVTDEVQVWVMKNATFLNSRISYDDIGLYEEAKGIDIIWAFDLNDKGQAKFIYEPLIP